MENKAEKLVREYAYKCHQEFESSSYLATDFIAGYNSRQSEIDELTNEVERLRNACRIALKYFNEFDTEQQSEAAYHALNNVLINQQTK